MEMRRKDRQVSREEAWEILEHSDYCVLSMTDAGGAPYGVALSFARMGEGICFHSAKAGRKVDGLLANPQVCVTAVERQRPAPEELSVVYRSAVGFGTARLVEDPEQRRLALEALCKKYAPENSSGMAEAAACSTALVWQVELTSLTGKANPGK